MSTLFSLQTHTLRDSKDIRKKAREAEASPQRKGLGREAVCASCLEVGSSFISIYRVTYNASYSL